MLISVWCATCSQETASCDVNDPETIGMLILSTHATNPHSNNHKLEVRFDGKPAPDGDHDLLIRCLHEGCSAPTGQEKRWKLPKWYASAAVLIFHASHEGHTLETFLDGRRYALKD